MIACRLLQLIPLLTDYADSQSNQTVQELTPQLIGVFEKVMGEPNDQLDDQTRQVLRQTVQNLYQAKPDLFSNHPGLLKLAGAS